MHLNETLRDQLEESHQTNDALTADLQKLTNDWEQLREEMLMKEDEWKEEEQVVTFHNLHSVFLIFSSALKVYIKRSH